MVTSPCLNHDFLAEPLVSIPGIAADKAALLAKELEIFTVGELLGHFPFRYEDRSRLYRIAELSESQAMVQLKGTLGVPRNLGNGRSQRLVATLNDGSGEVELVWFQGAQWITRYLTPGAVYTIYGKPQRFGRQWSISHPEIEKEGQEKARAKFPFTAVYPMTEAMRRRKVDHRTLAGMLQKVMDHPAFQVPEFIPADIAQRQQLMSPALAYRQIHFPDNLQLLEAARYRFKFEELFLLQLRINRMRGLKQTAFRGHSFEKVGDLFNGFYHHSLPFELTEAQKQVIREIRKDVLGGKQMNRLLQGDVGSGKTVVALMTMLLAADNGAQSALMAPTEILAFQHFESIRDLLGDLPVEVRLLTGSTTKKARAEILEGLRNGQVKILVGTHALLEGDVQFQQLGMVVIDEQHRFGVAQRAKLWGKGNPVPHVLVMTATPIPRTLAMTAYGDLDQSVIGELPKGRKPIRTVYKRDAERPSVMQFVKEQIDAGRQAYFVFPLIEESEKLELKDLMAGFDMVSDWFPTPRYQLSIVHGKMKPEQKEAEMQRFKRGASQVMVATTVIEVGVNVPNASVMVIQDADRFGLSQLHQLRGRVGRGAEQSYCILMSREGISEHARKRIDTMCRTNDGFEIARVDMELRGPGDIEGTRQSGMLDLKVADLIKDEGLLEIARLEAVKLLNADPDLLQEAHRALLFKLVARQGGNIWNRVL